MYVWNLGGIDWNLLLVGRGLKGCVGITWKLGPDQGGSCCSAGNEPQAARAAADTGYSREQYGR